MERGVYSLTNTMIQAMVVTASSSRARPDEAIHIKTERETKGVHRSDAVDLRGTTTQAPMARKAQEPVSELYKSGLRRRGRAQVPTASSHPRFTALRRNARL